jgi:hypothetical protein
MHLENISLFSNMEIFLQKNRGYLIHFFSLFLGGHLSTHCFRYLRHLSTFFSTLFSLFFFIYVNNFCIAHATSLQQKLWEISTWRSYLVNENLSRMFFVFTTSVGAKHFWVDLNGMACFCAYPQCRSSAYMGGVYVILILGAWQTSHKGQQSLTKLNAKQAVYMSGSFPNLNNMYGSGRNSSFVIQELIM